MSVDGAARILYFDNETYIGARELYCCGYSATDGRRSSAYYPNTAYFCPQCGQLWGRAIYEFTFAYQPIPRASWVIESRRCPQHGDGFFLSGIPDSHLPFCSTELLKREALLLSLHFKE